ncbi:Glucose-induced degradation protein like [Actinidia chinensis var. chinensis]|uniref:Glucose-induced degradation protein like n=1 Tax=Actinidia chinensis var. chinensis TaxID=1590841 RepID=A0A2R6Q018_ACTCC|nr:Glucose-induced degradation protein like [Actinidia chinensis var. chinensis]
MSFFYHEEPPNPTKGCKFLTSTLKDAFSNCRGRSSLLNTEEEDSENDTDNEQEVVVSEIRSRAMEAKTRRKSFTMDSFSWIFSPTTAELFITPKGMLQNEEINREEREDFFSVGSCFSCCLSERSTEAFLSVKTTFSRCSSLSGLDCRDFQPFLVQEFWHGLDIRDLRRRSMIQEFCHCEGWPFGLGRKALLLPPLPKSPSDSWSWRKRC